METAGNGNLDYNQYNLSVDDDDDESNYKNLSLGCLGGSNVSATKGIGMFGV